MTHPTTAPRNFSPKPNLQTQKADPSLLPFFLLATIPGYKDREVTEISTQHPKQDKMMQRFGSMNPFESFPLAHVFA
jgi:hypothetical protein